jgi:4-amino-4-deoxy-L-arabinose transferase-like glycosyltransferase
MIDISTQFPGIAKLVPRGPAPSLGRLVALALGLRVIAADLVQWYTQRKGVPCIFPDTGYYWLLAGKLAAGEPYEVVEFADLPHFSLRTPGYPLFLAAFRGLFGPRLLPVRLGQAVLGALCVVLVAWLARRALGVSDDPEPRAGRAWSVPLLAATLTAVEPFVVANSAVLLSEAVFLPLLLLAQCGFAGLWADRPEDGVVRPWRALFSGAATGAAVLVRPAWLLYAPIHLGVWLWFDGRRPGRRKAVLTGMALVALGFVAVMSPWWVRNHATYGRFVATALWSGASLYDGLNPRASGASDMAFLAEPDVWPLGEEAQDALLSRRSWAFVREHPGRALGLALVKAGRFWSPWPNAETFFSVPLALASALVTVPVFALIAMGAWDRRRDPRALALLTLPLVYTFLLHTIFVSSMRYRVPVIVPAFALAAVGVFRWEAASGPRSGETSTFPPRVEPPVGEGPG